MMGITRLYVENNVLANDRVDLEVLENEIHAIVGENGAGKTTLMKILYGLEHPDSGRIFFKGKEVNLRRPLDANRLGIGMVHQHFRLIPEFTVAENVVLGIEPKKRGFFFDPEGARREVREVIEEYGFSIDPSLRVWKLTAGQMQLIEIIKILYRKADLLILDEPTSVLTEQEIHRLFATLRNLAGIGKTVIIISHKLGEVKEISDRVTVMRRGRVVAVRKTSEVDERELSKLMVGKSVMFQFEREPLLPGRVVLELKAVVLKRTGLERPLLDGVNLSVHAGELVGVAGVGGNGLAELEDIICGLRRVSGGNIFHNGEDITGLSPSGRRERGLSYVPADRLNRGSSLPATVADNMIVSNHHRFLKVGIFNRRKVRDFVADLTGQYSIRCLPNHPIATLSGGNIQKVILARELASKSDFILFSEPTWGLDVAGSEFIYNKMLEIRKAGAAVLLISSNLDEIFKLADRVVVMFRGRVLADLENTKDLTGELIGEYMLGLRDDTRPEP